MNTQKANKLLSTMGKRGFAITQLANLAVVFVVVAIVLGLGGSILSQVQTSQVVNSTAYNASASGLTSLTTFASWLPTIALVVVAAIIIGIIYAYLMGGMGGAGPRR